MAMTDMEYGVFNGWHIYAHETFIRQFTELSSQVDAIRKKNPDTWEKSNTSKRFTAITRLITKVIPQDPKRPEFRQGNTLGKPYSHWHRAKFFQQYRLFFRFNEKQRIIIFVWVNDDKTKRAYGSKTDAYRVFEKMLKSGNPPDDWDELLKESSPIGQ